MRHLAPASGPPGSPPARVSGLPPGPATLAPDPPSTLRRTSSNSRWCWRRRARDVSTRCSVSAGRGAMTPGAIATETPGLISSGPSNMPSKMGNQSRVHQVWASFRPSQTPIPAQWQKPRIILGNHSRRLANGHRLVRAGCRCAATTHRLAKTECTWRRRRAGSRWAGRSGPCPGPRTVARAALAAFAWANQAAAGPLSHCLAVAHGAAAVGACKGAPALRGLRGDLWRRSVRCTITNRWVHKTHQPAVNGLGA